jgi:PAS domain S-box-containing protein
MVYLMVTDDNKIKISEEQMKKSSRQKEIPLNKKIEISIDDTRFNRIKHTIKEHKWLNLTLRYGLAIIIPIVALLLYGSLTILLGPGLPTYILFYPAIIIIALLAGLKPGIFATFISVILAGIWIIPPIGQFSFKSPVDDVGAILFTFFGILISVVAELYQRNREKAAAYDKEKTLRKTLLEKEFLADILNSSSQPFAISYPNGNLGLHNQAFEQLTGYTTEELHSIDWPTTLTPIEWRSMEKQKLDELHRTSHPVRYEKEYIHKNESRIPIEVLVNIALDGEGRPEYYYSFITDITERKKAEIALQDERDLLQIIMNGTKNSHLVYLDREFNFIRVNEAYARTCGYTPEEMIGKNHFDLYPNEENEAIFASVRDTGKAVEYHDKPFEFPDQPERGVTYWDWTLTPIKSQEETVGLIFSLYETTKSKLAEIRIKELLENEQLHTEELQSANEKLIKIQHELTKTINKLATSNEELEQFAYVASHDLQEPLRMVASFTQLLEKRYKDQLDEDADDYIGFIVEGAQRMKDLIDDLLAFSRLNTDAKGFKSTDLINVLDDVLLYLKPSIDENNVKVTIDSLPIIKCDYTQIRQLFQNLISNAIKFHSDKQPEINISAQDSGKVWLFSVSDNGIGIDAEHQKKIFDVFRRLHTRDEFEGTGIGLAICKRIVNRHRGQIWVESEPGKGSTFYFTIPKII